MQILAFLDTNMLVSPTRNRGIGGLSQREDFVSQWNIGLSECPSEGQWSSQVTPTGHLKENGVGTQSYHCPDRDPFYLNMSVTLNYM